MLIEAAITCSILGSSPVSFQTSTVVLGPGKPLPLGGYTARNSKVSDPGGQDLMARTVLVQGRYAIVSVEMLTIPESLYEEVQRRVGPNIQVWLAATHTHCAPDSQMLNRRMTMSVPGIARFDPSMLDLYSGQIAEGIRAAKSAPIRSSLRGRFTTRWANLNRNRRGNSPPSRRLTFFSLQPEDVSPLFVHYAAHPTLLGPEHNTPHGDWPGAVSQKLGGVVLNGAIGDVSPSAPSGEPLKQVQQFADAIAALWTDRLKEEDQDRSIRPVLFASIQLPETQPEANPFFVKEFGVPEVLAQRFVQTTVPKTAVISGIRLGKLALVGIPGEPSDALGRAIAEYGEGIGFTRVLVVSNVNGWIGYLLSPEDYRRGGYEAALMFQGERRGQAVVEHAKKLLDQLVDPTR